MVEWSSQSHAITCVQFFQNYLIDNILLSKFMFMNPLYMHKSEMGTCFPCNESLTLTLAPPLWLCFMLYGWINNTQHMFAHLVPQGTPAILMPFMVCIETISNVIRPGTLAVRLTANMIAGHLLLTLLENTGPSLSMVLISFLIITQIALLVLESAVAMIQSYVFAVLSTLYSSEVN